LGGSEGNGEKGESRGTLVSKGKERAAKLMKGRGEGRGGEGGKNWLCGGVRDLWGNVGVVA